MTDETVDHDSPDVPGQGVVSGAPYVVHTVGGRIPYELADFVAAQPASVTASFNDRRIEICGMATLIDDVVSIYEKDDSGVGKDIRTWHVRVNENQFTATARSLY